MKLLKLHWIGDLEVSEENRPFYPLVITIKPYEKTVRLGRSNSTNPPHIYFISMMNSRMLSRNHATIEVRDNGETFEIQDYSINGTFVNYRRVQGRVPLRQNDILCLGHMRGSSIPSGKKVDPFKTDLKFRVSLEEEDSETGGQDADEEEQSQSRLHHRHHQQHHSRERHISAASHSTTGSSQQQLRTKPIESSSSSSSRFNNNFPSQHHNNSHELLNKKKIKRHRHEQEIRTKRKLIKSTAIVNNNIMDDDDDEDFRGIDNGSSDHDDLTGSGSRDNEPLSPPLSTQSLKRKKPPTTFPPTFSNTNNNSGGPGNKSSILPSQHKKTKTQSTLKSESSTNNTIPSSLMKPHKQRANNKGGANIFSSPSSSGDFTHSHNHPSSSHPDGTGNSGGGGGGNTVEECAARNHCLQPSGNNIDWVACDFCSKWYHMQCVGFSKMEQDQDFYCKRCIKKSRRERADGTTKHTSGGMFVRRSQ